MDKPIIIIKYKEYMKPELLDRCRQVFERQMAYGLIVLPDGFDVAVVNADKLDCSIKLINDASNKDKKFKKWGRFFQKVFFRKNKA